jgi:hypothetical protein
MANKAAKCFMVILLRMQHNNLSPDAPPTAGRRVNENDPRKVSTRSKSKTKCAVPSYLPCCLAIGMGTSRCQDCHDGSHIFTLVVPAKCHRSA